ncbi:hypothetical protein KMW28_06810 [Flammeovirga yaeyamensis]|uniref:DUF1835 domain-containing protein n=1 Tax=Flammeovirga yaeyamensis TaxID=367791 RepID=A0AAX1NB90_9BACT|nr:hypothetical protein [Flammeovirga yaeyamensis]MBB3697885.1 hypothetical protein [Flammeovirga yaeyamensis]NMF35760.1 hypothetical protein [Flammeovirga yaeyamensis]QWG03288.1 hypothetical protein KMW28_06810 [Flammeovirga yaeyamensis]
MKNYHILNGDSILEAWRHQNFDAEPIIFREMLVEGESMIELWTHRFFEKRKHFFLTNYGVSFEDYNSKSGVELQKMNQLVNATTITLWFENDLFCHINLMATLHFIHQLNMNDVEVYLVLGEGTKGLGEYTKEAFGKLYHQKVKLDADDLAFASKFWELYTKADLDNFITYIKRSPKFLPLLKEVMTTYMEQFPQKESGINKLERRILKFLNDEPLTEHKLIGKLLRRQTYEGFGDLQYEKILKQLSSSLIEKEEDDHLVLSSEGKKVLRGLQKFDDEQLPYQFYGGAMRTEYYYDEEKSFLIGRN